MPAPLKVGCSWTLAPPRALCPCCLAVSRRRKCFKWRKSMRTAPDYHFLHCQQTALEPDPGGISGPWGIGTTCILQTRGIPGKGSCLLLSWRPADTYAVPMTTRKARHSRHGVGVAAPGGGRSVMVHLSWDAVSSSVVRGWLLCGPGEKRCAKPVSSTQRAQCWLRRARSPWGGRHVCISHFNTHTQAHMWARFWVPCI